ncbi:HAD-IB family phosphatase [Paenibacillus radicis (ex Gao et al. 2016)]|uniref:phosphoserine phosphatase n=1 Tax=Paenibacillus radicis (ex Gao et al. 2016) TaxID=1737354 RepID=A0A917HAD9_9BACL|nr:HAD-IB family phosphatase [Paenibacillus radicis (ex Gao et al. 2016)]GGG72240.1 hydrolase [Paenibacillus radicis (ex Gao et al. 2016)]
MDNNLVFLFDLDGTITAEETLPKISKYFGIDAQIDILTQETLNGNIPFVESFIRRVDILKQIPVSDINNLLEEVRLFSVVVHFIRQHSNQCYIVTGNLTDWIEKLVSRIGCGFFASKGEVHNDRLIKLTEILKKEDVVKQFKKQGKTVVFIGDGNNDSEAMRESDISIACGLTHYPANSVLSVADYAVFSEASLLRLLHQIQSRQPGKSVILSCAGIGSRLGLGQTKALIELHGKKLIEIQLDSFRKMEDVRIVIGFQSNVIIQTVLKIRTDVIFVYNHDYFQTKTGASFYLGARHANEYAIAWDGDLLVHPEDIEKCLSFEGEYIGCSSIVSDDPVYIQTDADGQAIAFSYDSGVFEWSGPACLRSSNVKYVVDNVFNQIEELLPLTLLQIRARDIDTYEDYKNALHFTRGWK